MPVYTPVKHMPRHRYPYQTRERVRKGIGLSKLLLNSSRMVDMHNSMYVKPFKVEKLRDLQGRTVFRAYTHTNDPRFPPERDHSPTIRPKDVNYKGKISNCPSVVLSCTCLVGDTRVLTKDGYKTIYSLVNPFSNPLIDFPIEYKVNEDVYRGTAPFYTGKKPVWELSLSNDTKITATKDHKFLVYRGVKTHRTYKAKGRNQKGSNNNNSCMWRIESKDGYEVVDDIKAWCRETDSNYSRLCTNVANGKTYKGLKITKWRKEPRGIAPIVYSETYSFIEEWVELKDLKVGDKVVIHKDVIEQTVKDLHYWQSYVFGAFHGDGTLNPFSITCKSNPAIIKFFKKAKVFTKLESNHRYLLGVEAKAILHTMGCLNNRHFIDVNRFNIFGFLSGLLDTDGCVRDSSIEYCGSIELRVVADKLKEMGVHGVTFDICRKKGTRTNKGIASRDMYRLRISQEGCRQIIDNLDGDKARKLRKRILLDKNPNNRNNCAKVIGKKYKGKKDVYDITVPKAHRFVAESAIVHNCARWTFLWEYADALRGDGLIWYGNGEPPLVTNPSYYPALCIAKGELVLTLRGNTPIEQVTANDKVWTLDGWKQVLAAACTGFKDTITLKTNSGRSLTLTQDHEVYASLSGNPFSWIEAGDITTDHSLCFSIPLVLSQDNAQEYSVPDRVVEIIKNDEGSDVYDLTVKDAEHFTANGFVVHNCKHLISFSRWLKARGL